MSPNTSLQNAGARVIESGKTAVYMFKYRHKKSPTYSVSINRALRH
nr:MAG TPA_asm: hypothetical protein [Bacteriophage sp.]